MTDRLSLEALRYARAVGETSSFSAAARAEGVTQPALSNAIARLETTLGERLFDRSPRGVTPTAFGARLLPLIDASVASLEAVGAEARRWHAPSRESIRVGVSPLIDPALVARTHTAVAEAREPAPRQLVLREANMADLRGALVEGDLDLVIIPSVEAMPHYEHRVVASEPLVLIERDGGAAVHADLAEIADRQLILMPDTCGLTAFTRDLLDERSLPIRTYPGEASSYRMLEEWSALGLGSAMLPESKVTDPQTSHRAVLDEDGAPIEIFYEAVWDPRSALAGELQALASRLVSAAD